NKFNEFIEVDFKLALENALKSSYGLLWMFTKYNEIIESNKNINAIFWSSLIKATEFWWRRVFKDREMIISYQSKPTTLSKYRKRRLESKDIFEEKEISPFIANWRLFQLLKATQNQLTSETIVNMLLGANDLVTDIDNNYENLRDIQTDLEPLWFVELPLKLAHGEKYLKIRLNNRIIREGKLFGYPLLEKSLTSIKDVKITFETQWLQRFVIDHIFVPNNQWEYENYEINPTNTWLSDIYIMDLSDHSKKQKQVELTYKLEFSLESDSQSEETVEFRSTNRRLIIPIYRKNNFERLERFIVTNSNALAIFLAVVSLFASVFDISGNFINYSGLNIEKFLTNIILIGISMLILAIPGVIWGRKERDKAQRKENISKE
ncbi:MAG: hypothetical protein ACXAC7_22770, partial [Candidatus Hodarchaeales archaeon]